ncbi:MAG: hypothetical protein KDB32_12270, partial [Planctomycetes bacterium]|nr:hypothetical protein [Planctomycetota bacterium]
MRYLVMATMFAMMLLTGCSSGPDSMIGESKQDVLADVDVADITTDRMLVFGADSLDMYANFGEFLNDKVALGGELTPALEDVDADLKGRAEVAFTTVMERTNEARAGRESSTATIW